MRVEIQNQEGKPIPGFTLADCHPLKGDQLDGGGIVGCDDAVIGHVRGRALEVDPANILAPGIAVEFAGGRVNGHATVGGGKIDPAHVGAPGGV